MVMILQTMTPVAGLAKGFTPKQKNMVKVGDVDIKSYPQPSLKTIQEANRRKKLQSQGGIIPGGARLFSSPYFPGQDPADDKKPLIYANVNAVFSTKGLDGGNFDWEGVFGKDQDGKPNKAQIVFEQIDNDTSTRTGVKFFLKVGQDGTYTWSDDQGKPTKLPLYSNELKPFKYEVLLDEDVTDHVKLLTARFFGTEEKYYFGEPDPVTGEIVGEINLDLTLQQVASTKFTSKWNTGVEEANRPTVEGSFLPGNETDPEMYGIFKFPSNDTEKTIIRNDQLDPNNPGEYSEYRARDLEKTPKVDVADPDPDSTDTYTIDRDNNKISYNGKTYKYQVDYDVINGGKLTMTEIIPVTFDANGGKFASIVDPNVEQKIVKEVDYEKDLTGEVEKPTKDRETFKGWGIKDQSGTLTPVKDADYKAIKEAKTFYAIWDNNDIVAEELEVKESFKDGTDYVNDFIPTLDQLKKQVKIKDSNGDPQPLANDDTFEILDDSGAAITGDTLKDYLYEKLKEKDNPNDEPTRVETVKAKVTVNGTSKIVEIPIKVIKNIYEAKTLTEKPFYVPDGYVRVTVDPTKKATESQRTYYYVNPAANVLIPGKDPVGTDGNNFINWTMKPDSAAPEAKGDVYTLANRNRFEDATTITANYVGNVVEQPDPNDDNTKPTVPKEFVKVIVDKTDKAKLDQGEKQTQVFWVKPATKVRIEVKDPVAANKEKAFNRWKKEDEPNRFFNINLNDKQEFRKEVTRIQAFYSDLAIEQKEGQPKPDTVPDNFIRIYLDTTDKATVKKRSTWWVAPDKSSIKIVLDSPVGKEVTKGNSSYKWQFNDRWKSESNEVKATSSSGTNKIYEINTTKVSPEEIFYAQYTTDNVIPKFNDDGSENDKPDGYVTLTFDKGDHGKEITGQTVYYVNPKASPAKTLGNDSIKKPEVKAKTGWKQKAGADAWDTLDTFEIKADKTVKAQYEAITDVIPQGKEDGSDKPDGYITVTFSTETNGKIEGSTKTTKVVYVNPNKAVVLKDEAPKVMANTGFEFAGWDTQIERAIQYTENTVIKAKYKTIDDVIPQEKTDGSDKPAGYYIVTFDKGDHGKELTGKTVYYVKPNTEVTVPAPGVTPASGWVQKAGTDAWDQALTQTFAKDTTIKAQYDPLGDIIAQGKPDGSDKPDGYITVTFAKGDHGELSGKTVYYVNPNAGKTLADVTHPTIQPNTGFKAKEWDKDDATAITGTDDMTVTAQYEPIANIIPETNDDGSKNDKPEGYVTVKFIAGTHGSLTGQTVYFVNPKAGVTIGDAAADKVIAAPVPNAETDYAFDKWAPEIDKTTSITSDQNYVAQFVYNPATVKLTYEAPDKTSGDVPGAQTVKKGDKVILADVNTLKKDNATFKGWMIDGKEYAAGASVTLEKDSTATALWTTNSHTVSFDTNGGSFIPPRTVEHGKPIGQIDPPTKPGFTFTGWTLNGKSFDPTKDTITSNSTLLANYVPNVVEQKDPDKKPAVPDNFVPVTVDPTNKAIDPATKVFWVKPNETVQIPAEQPTGKKDGDTTYVFDSWNPSLIGKFTEPTTITAQYKEQTPQKPIFDPRITTRVVATDLNKEPPLDAYKDQIISESHKEFDLVEIVEQPKVNESGFTSAKIKIRFTENGMTKVVDVLVYVKPDPVIIEKPYPVPGDCNNSCDQPNQPNQPNIGMDALNTTDHYQYLIGYPDGNFAPNRGMTRAEVATMFTRLLKERPVKGQRYYTGFSDIQAGDWYANTVGYAVQVGIVSGYPDGSFKPNKPITRAEFASIASRFDALAQGNDIAFNDLAPSHWGYNAIRSAATKGWISGYPDNTFRPEKAISRAEVTSITNRMLNRYADLYWIDAHRGEVIRFGDVKRGDWYFEPIMEATMGHDFIRDRDGKTEHWTGLNGKSFI